MASAETACQKNQAASEMFFPKCLIRVEAERVCHLNWKGGIIVKIKTGVNAGRLSANHNQTVKRLRFKSNLKAGKLSANHNQTLAL
jgi:hypothetical protein